MVGTSTLAATSAITRRLLCVRRDRGRIYSGDDRGMPDCGRRSAPPVLTDDDHHHYHRPTALYFLGRI